MLLFDVFFPFAHCALLQRRLYINGFGQFLGAPVPIEISNYAIEICKIVRHDDLVRKPDSGLPNSHGPLRDSNESLEDLIGPHGSHGGLFGLP